jgi:hypothetical protein
MPRRSTRRYELKMQPPTAGEASICVGTVQICRLVRDLGVSVFRGCCPFSESRIHQLDLKTARVTTTTTEKRKCGACFASQTHTPISPQDCDTYSYTHAHAQPKQRVTQAPPGAGRGTDRPTAGVAPAAGRPRTVSVRLAREPITYSQHIHTHTQTCALASARARGTRSRAEEHSGQFELFPIVHGRRRAIGL